MGSQNSNADSDFGPFLQSPSGQRGSGIFVSVGEVAKQRARRSYGARVCIGGLIVIRKSASMRNSTAYPENGAVMFI